MSVIISTSAWKWIIIAVLWSYWIFVTLTMNESPFFLVWLRNRNWAEDKRPKWWWNVVFQIIVRARSEPILPSVSVFKMNLCYLYGLWPSLLLLNISSHFHLAPFNIAACNKCFPGKSSFWFDIKQILRLTVDSSHEITIYLLIFYLHLLCFLCLSLSIHILFLSFVRTALNSMGNNILSFEYFSHCAIAFIHV